MRRNLVPASVLLLLSVSVSAQGTPSDNPSSPPTIADSGNAERSNGGIEVLSDTRGVNFATYLQQWNSITQRNWREGMTEVASASISTASPVAIDFKLLPDGTLMPNSVYLVGRSGSAAIDRAAWSAVTRSSYPSLPSDFAGPYLELRVYFKTNTPPK
jgi:hypothetical protein